MTTRPPVIRWRGEVAEEYYKEGMKFYHTWDRRYLRKKFLLKYIALPSVLLSTCVIFGYLNVKSQGMLHVLHNGREGVREYYDHTLGRHIRTHFADEKALRQREAYRKALELKEEKIMEKYRKYEEVES